MTLATLTYAFDTPPKSGPPPEQACGDRMALPATSERVPWAIASLPFGSCAIIDWRSAIGTFGQFCWEYGMKLVEMSPWSNVSARAMAGPMRHAAASAIAGVPGRRRGGTNERAPGFIGVSPFPVR